MTSNQREMVFVKWLSGQPKLHGDGHLTAGTVNCYKTKIRRCRKQFTNSGYNPGTISNDLFAIYDPVEFGAQKQIISNTPGYDEVNRRGHGQLSNALCWYHQFLRSDDRR